MPYLLIDLDRKVPIYATKLTLGLIGGKLKEHKIKNAKLCEIKPGQSIKLGCITAEFFSVNHSIPVQLAYFSVLLLAMCFIRATLSWIKALSMEFVLILPLSPALAKRALT